MQTAKAATKKGPIDATIISIEALIMVKEMKIRVESHKSKKVGMPIQKYFETEYIFLPSFPACTRNIS